MSDITPAQAAALVEADRQRRVQAVRAAIHAALNEHKCEIQAMPQIVDGGIVAVIQIAPGN